MKAVLLFFIVIIFFHCAFSHLFHHDIMSEDPDVTYGLPGVRVRRDTWGNAGRVGPLYTHVKTDEGGTFKWGTKHMVGAMFASTKHNDEDTDDVSEF